MKINQKKAGVFLSYLGQAIHIISGLVYTPIMLRLLGQSEYGLYQLVNSIVSYLSLLNLGFNSSYMRFYARAEKSDDKSEIARLNGMFMIIFTIITIVCLLCGVVMVINIEGIFSSGLTAEEYTKARVLMALMVIGLSTTMFSSVFTCNMTAHEQFFFQRLLTVLQNLFNPFITLPLLIMGYGSVAMVVVSTSLVIIKFIVSVIFCFKKLDIKFSFKHLQFKLLTELGTFTFFIFLNQIIDKVNWSLDKVLLGRFCGTIEVAIYGVASNINLMFQNFCSAISSVFVPQVNRIVAQKHDNYNYELSSVFSKVGRLQFIIAYLIVSGYIFFGQNFIKLWAGDGYDKAYYVGLLLLIPASMELIQYLGIEIQRAKNKHKVRSVVYFLISIGNIAISIPLINKFGSVGAAIGTAVAMILGTWIFMNIYYKKGIHLDIAMFWKNIAKFIPSLIPSIITGILIYRFADTSSWIKLFLFIAIYTIVYAAGLLLFGLNAEEKGMVTSMVNKVIRKKVK